MQLGMIGLGRMGANMVRRLLGGGHECVVQRFASRGEADFQNKILSAMRYERGGSAFSDKESGGVKWTNCSSVTAIMPTQRSRDHETLS
jgi:6-phosphogluconate dehydrogenase (decarboxylating)